MKCCLCYSEMKVYGHNPHPLCKCKQDRQDCWCTCCTTCNTDRVIPIRLVLDDWVKSKPLTWLQARQLIIEHYKKKKCLITLDKFLKKFPK